jgi:hypothetical protein
VKLEKQLTKQERYKKGLPDKGLREIKIVVPEREVENLREWAQEMRQELKEENRS